MNNTLSYYEIFYTVARQGSISRAASELFISQPAVSKAIRKLEQNLSVTLFIRTARGVSLTEDGKLLFSHVETALSSLSEGEYLLKKNRDLEVGHLHIGVSTTLCKYVMLPYLQSFTTANPHIHVAINCLSSADTARGLEENRLDLGLIGHIPGLRNVEFEKLLEIEDTFVTSKQYLDSLALREGIEPSSASRELFARATLILLDRENISRQHLDSYFERHGITPGQVLETSSMDLLVDFARVNLGIACVIRDIVREEIENGTLIEIPLTHKIPKRTVGFAYSKAAKQNPAVEKFREFILSR
ncbi:MAG: LysR family transcriptional regulator [Lachnospiraceae bacterium]|nr:LysR family transcriptional regulator [Lachnospiraceae bacterium]